MTLSHMVEAEVVAKALSISTSAVYQLAKRKELPFESFKFGRIVRFRRIDVEAFLGGPIESGDELQPIDHDIKSINTDDDGHTRINGQVIE